MRKRLESIVLCLALLLSLAPALSGSTRAAGNANTLYIAGKTGAAYGHEEPGYNWGNWVYDEGWTELRSGESVSYGNSYDNGATAAFTRADSGSSTLTLNGYLTYGNAGYENGSDLYGIYYDGNLIVQVYDECELQAYRSDTFNKVYGIYVTGDLTIETAKGASLAINMSCDPNMQTSLAACGIYCGGMLTINGSGSVYATAGTVSGGEPGRSFGILCGTFHPDTGYVDGVVNKNVFTVGGSAKVTARGGKVNLEPFSATVMSASCGVAAKSVVVETDGGLIAAGGDLINTHTGAISTYGGQTAGIVAQNYSQTRGTATVTGGGTWLEGKVYGTRKESYGLLTSTFSMEGGTLACAAGFAYGENCGLYVHGGAATLGGGSVRATAGDVVGMRGGSYSEGGGSRGAEFTGSFTATAGTLEATGGNAHYSVPSIGVRFSQTPVLGGTASVKGTGGDFLHSEFTMPDGNDWPIGYISDSIGIYVTGSALTVDDSAALTGQGGYISSENPVGGYPDAGSSYGIYLLGGGEDCTVSGTGTLSGTGGAIGYGFISSDTANKSFGVYSHHSLTVEGTSVIATGGDTGGEQTTAIGNQAITYGLYVNNGAASFTGCAVTATGGNAKGYHGTNGRYVNNSYGAYFTGDLSLDQAELTAASGVSLKNCGLHLEGTLTLFGNDARLNAEALTLFKPSGSVYFTPYAYGMETNTEFAVTAGKATLTGATRALDPTYIGYTAPIVERSKDAKSIVLDATRAIVSIYGWTYGDQPGAPRVQNLEKYGDGSVTAAYEYSARGEDAYSETVPTNAGDYTVRATLSNGVTGTADFTIARRGVTIRARDQVVPLGGEIEGGAEQVYLPTGELVEGHCVASVTLTPSSVDYVTTDGTVTPSDAVIEDAEGENVTANYDITYEPGRLIVKGTAPMLACELRWGDTLLWTAVNAPAGAKLIAARYDGGRLTDVRIVTVSGDARGELAMGGSGDEYRLLLVDGATFAPLCPAWENGRK